MSDRLSEIMSIKAWRYSAIEGLREALAIAIAVFAVNAVAALFFLHRDLVGWLIQSAKLSMIALALGFLLLTPYSRWALWRNNQVKPK